MGMVQMNGFTRVVLCSRQEQVCYGVKFLGQAWACQHEHTLKTLGSRTLAACCCSGSVWSPGAAHRLKQGPAAFDAAVGCECAVLVC